MSALVDANGMALEVQPQIRKAIRLDNGTIRVPHNMTDEEWDYALSLHTPDEFKRLGKTVDRQLKWMLWQLKHPTLAGILGAFYATGLSMIGAHRR